MGESQAVKLRIIRSNVISPGQPDEEIIVTVP